MGGPRWMDKGGREAARPCCQSVSDGSRVAAAAARQASSLCQPASRPASGGPPDRKAVGGAGGGVAHGEGELGTLLRLDGAGQVHDVHLAALRVHLHAGRQGGGAGRQAPLPFRRRNRTLSSPARATHAPQVRPRSHHDGHRESLVLVQLADALHHASVVVVAAVRQVEARHVHAPHRQLLQHLGAVAGRSDGGHKLGAPRGAEACGGGRGWVRGGGSPAAAAAAACRDRGSDTSLGAPQPAAA